jgi:hypothetical protein
MAFREVSVIEIREVLRSWLAGAGLRTVAAQAVPFPWQQPGPITPASDTKNCRRIQASVRSSNAIAASASSSADQ